MSLLRKWRRIRADWRVLCSAWGVVSLIRIGLWMLPFPYLHKALARVGQRPVSFRRRRASPASIAWAVANVSRCVPMATCLTQALATDFLLSRMGYHGNLRIGVRLQENASLAAHAWVEYDGGILIGGQVQQQFTPLPPIDRVHETDGV